VENGAWTITCGDKVSPVAPMEPKAARVVLAKATFRSMLLDRDAFALGRDGTTYYYVDSEFADAPKDFRLYIGKRGAMKRQKIKDTAGDQGGHVFTTALGKLEVTTKGALTWQVKGKPLALTAVPIDPNLSLVYSDLGVYGTKFGLPCDDFQ